MSETIQERPAGPAINEEHYTVLYLAQRWNLSSKIIRRWFQKEPGVLKVPGISGRRTFLRVPASVAERVYRERSA